MAKQPYGVDQWCLCDDPKCEPKFHGWDWTELFPYLTGMPVPKNTWKKGDDIDEYENKLLEDMRKVLSEVSEVEAWGENGSPNGYTVEDEERICADVREFLLVLAGVDNEDQSFHGEGPMWIGITKMENWNLLKYVSILLPNMWT